MQNDILIAQWHANKAVKMLAQGELGKAKDSWERAMECYHAHHLSKVKTREPRETEALQHG